MKVAYRTLKSLARRGLPDPILRQLAEAKGVLKVAAAKVVFRMAGTSSRALPIVLLNSMYESYPSPPGVRYDAEGLALRADENVAEMSRWVDLRKVRCALEIGCWDGMVADALARTGIRCYGLDLDRNGFDPRARKDGVTFVQANANSLPFASGTLDLIFSFAAFEHFPRPQLVVQEAARVLRPRGLLFLEFGPIATSPYGLHAYRSIPVPYIQVLFDRQEIVKFAEAHGETHDWPYINGVTLREYRQIFEQAKRDFLVLHYEERPSGGVGAELILRYPGVFRRASDCVDDFLVTTMAVCLERR